MEENTDQLKKRLQQRTLKVAMSLLIMFALLAILSSLLGGWIDKTYGTRPYGEIGTMVVSMVMSWVLAYFIYTKMMVGIKNPETGNTYK